MSDKEKEQHHHAYVLGGYLKVFKYKTAFRNLWKTLNNDEKSSFKTLPNFDPNIFKDITGIKI